MRGLQPVQPSAGLRRNTGFSADNPSAESRRATPIRSKRTPIDARVLQLAPGSRSDPSGSVCSDAPPPMVGGRHRKRSLTPAAPIVEKSKTARPQRVQEAGDRKPSPDHRARIAGIRSIHERTSGASCKLGSGRLMTSMNLLCASAVCSPIPADRLACTSGADDDPGQTDERQP